MLDVISAVDHTHEEERRARLEGQVAELSRRVEDLEEWLAAVANDLLDRTQGVDS